MPSPCTRSCFKSELGERDPMQEALAEIERLRPFEEAHNKLTEELQALGEEFGCVGGQNRVAWLKEQLERLERIESAAEDHRWD